MCNRSASQKKFGANAKKLNAKRDKWDGRLVSIAAGGVGCGENGGRESKGKIVVYME